MNAAPAQIVMRDGAGGRWLAFDTPRQVLAARTLADVLPTLRAVEARVDRDGLWAAGFVAYEAAPAFDGALAVQADDGSFPPVWFALCDPPRDLEIQRPDAAPREPPELHWAASVTEAAYGQSFARIKAWIRAGDTYQVNYSHRLRAALPAGTSPWLLFRRLSAAQGPGYGAFVDTGRWVLCSASPELFFSLDGERIESRPMKGTRPRGLTAADDRALAAALRGAEKDRAENVMIVDMVRNDLGRIARPGSVTVAALFEVEKYPTVWQMTSRVSAATPAPVTEIFRALFPAASITGAPKTRTMQIIAEVECSPRRIYTGAIGFIAPGRRAQFNVAIRTVQIDTAGATAEYGVGGGIVWDSVNAAEQTECRNKAAILHSATPDFELLETLRWTPSQGYDLLDRHLDRLLQSAVYFDIPVAASDARCALETAARGFPPLSQRVRLLVDRAGRVMIESSGLEPTNEPRRVALARHPVDSGDVFLYHKTTHRRVYEDARRACPGVDDVILFNADGEVTESTVANVAVEVAGALVTPPVRCGLLAGTLRAQMLEEGRLREGVLRLEHLRRSPRLVLINSVRGVCRAYLADQ